MPSIGTPSLLDLILTNLPENIFCSSSAPIGSSDHMLVKVDISSLWLLLENHFSTVESGISLRPTGRDFKQPSNFKTGLPLLLSPPSPCPGNSFKETCSLSCTDLSPLVFSCPTLPPEGRYTLVSSFVEGTEIAFSWICLP